MKVELYWEDDGEYAYLYAGGLIVELAWLHRRKKHWAAYTSLPGLKPRREYDTLENQKADIEALVRRWFNLAADEKPNVPA